MEVYFFYVKWEICDFKNGWDDVDMLGGEEV